MYYINHIIFHSKINGMKKIKIMGIVTLLMLNFSFAASSLPGKRQGLYLTYNDFINRHIVYGGGSKIILHQFTASPGIKIIETNGKVVKLKKSNVFGYCDEKGQSFRFYNNELYKIIDNGKILVYSFYALSNTENGKGMIDKKKYFFSLSGNSELMLLTVPDLKKMFPYNLKFHDLLNNIKSSEELVYYIESDGHVKANYLLQKSLQN
jgi:hypothetical protein